MQPLVTIIIPTTGDRASLVEFALKSILKQTIQSFEVFIIGDGVIEPSASMIREWCKQDQRFFFFEHPKHERRGEVYRHQALMQRAKGKIVCYLCDRDLLLPNHLEVHLTYASSHNFVLSNFYDMQADGTILLNAQPTLGTLALFTERERQHFKAGRYILSKVSHSLAFYKSLPWGWRTTPIGIYTDNYMWQQFASQEGINPYATSTPTLLYFKRGDFPGISVAEREKELAYWMQRMASSEWNEDATKGLDNLMRNHQELLEYAQHPTRNFFKANMPSLVIRKLLQIITQRTK